jgi:hypothetical protein
MQNGDPGMRGPGSTWWGTPELKVDAEGRQLFHRPAELLAFLELAPSFTLHPPFHTN